MKLWCFFPHSYQCIAVEHYYDTSYEMVDGVPSTTAVYRCQKCGTIKRKLYYAVGHLTIEQLNHHQQNKKPTRTRSRGVDMLKKAFHVGKPKPVLKLVR